MRSKLLYHLLLQYLLDDSLFIGIDIGISGQVQPALHHGLVSTLQKLHVFKRGKP
jgi:hypothetical protein